MLLRAFHCYQTENKNGERIFKMLCIKMTPASSGKSFWLYVLQVGVAMDRAGAHASHGHFNRLDSEEISKEGHNLGLFVMF